MNDNFRVDKETARRTVQKANKCVNRIKFNKNCEQSVAPFDPQEIIPGGLLGMGSFSTVHEVHDFVPLSKRNISSKQQQARLDLIGQDRYETPSFAVKTLREDCAQDKDKFFFAAIDLAKEATLLKRLDHPNIIKIRGESADGIEAYKSGIPDSFFILIDRLDKNLRHQITEWRRQSNRLNMMKRAVDRKGTKRQKLLLDRLKVALSIAEAMEYLHDNNLIFRDLKPSNIGIDADGTVKIFDFGLCREVPQSSKTDDTFCMSGGAGSWTYMAPEVRNNDEYNVKADVYSFATVLFEILSMDNVRRFKWPRPHKWSGWSPHDEFLLRVSRICDSWPRSLRDLLRASWSSDVAKRPTMKEVVGVLRASVELALKQI